MDDPTSSSTRTRPKRKSAAVSHLQDPKTKKPRRVNTESEKKNPPTLLALPNEIVDQIAANIPETRDIASMSRVTRTFADSMTKALYTSSKIESSIIDIDRLALFTRTMICSSDLADQIQTIELGNPMHRTERSFPKLRLEKIFREDSHTYRLAAREVSISSVLRDRSSPEVLRDDFYAILISRLPNLRGLIMHIHTQHKTGYHFEATVTQSMDQLLQWVEGGKRIKGLKRLEELAIFTITTPEINRAVLGVKCPSFVNSILRIPTLKKYTTDHVRPEKMPYSAISALDLSRNHYRMHAPALHGLRPRFLVDCYQLSELAWTFGNFDFIPTHLLPPTLERLKLFEVQGPAFRVRLTEYLDFFSKLVSLELHCKWSTITPECTTWLFANIPTTVPLTLVLYGLENADRTILILTDDCRNVLTILRHRSIHLNPIRFEAAVDMERLDDIDTAIVEWEFATIKEICGNMPMVCFPPYFNGHLRSAQACETFLLDFV